MPASGTVESIPGGFKVIDGEGKVLAYCYGLDPRELPAAATERLSLDEARRVAADIAKLPELLRGQGEF